MSYRFQKNPVYSYVDAIRLIAEIKEYETVKKLRSVILSDKDNYTGREYLDLFEKVNRKMVETIHQIRDKDDE